MWLDVESALLHAELPNDGRMRALDDADDIALGPPIASESRDAPGDTVPVHRLGGHVRRQEQVAFNAFDRLIRDQETEAVAVHRNAAGDQRRLLLTLVLLRSRRRGVEGALGHRIMG